MYRLNLDDPRLVLPVAIYHVKDEQSERDYLLRESVEEADQWSDIESIRSGKHDDERVGIFKKVDLHRLIESVYVSAESKPWFIELVKKVLRRYETNVPVRKSDLASEPLFR